MTSPLTVEDYRDYAKSNVGSWTDDDIQGAIDTETRSQSNKCRIEDPYPPDMLEALKRRVQRNLTLRGQPALTVQRIENGVSFTPTNDPEVRRLEGPYRKVFFGESSC